MQNCSLDIEPKDLNTCMLVLLYMHLYKNIRIDIPIKEFIKGTKYILNPFNLNSCQELPGDLSSSQHIGVPTFRILYLLN